MLPYLIAGAIGFGIAKLFEKDDTKKFDNGGSVYDNLPILAVRNYDADYFKNESGEIVDNGSIKRYAIEIQSVPSGDVIDYTSASSEKEASEMIEKINNTQKLYANGGNVGKSWTIRDNDDLSVASYLNESQLIKWAKQLAKELMIPIIALSQLSRSVELTKDKKPLLSSLRESGQIEADADLVIMLYRPEYYKITEDENGESTEGVCWVLIPKNRNGKTGEVKMIFDGSRFRFETFGTQQVSPKLEPPKSFFPSDMYNDDSDNTGNLKDVPF